MSQLYIDIYFFICEPIEIKQTLNVKKEAISKISVNKLTDKQTKNLKIIFLGSITIIDAKNSSTHISSIYLQIAMSYNFLILCMSRGRRDPGEPGCDCIATVVGSVPTRGNEIFI